MFRNTIRSRSGMGLLAGCAAVMVAYLAMVGLFVSQYGHHPDEISTQSCTCPASGQPVACQGAVAPPTC